MAAMWDNDVATQMRAREGEIRGKDPPLISPFPLRPWLRDMPAKTQIRKRLANEKKFVIIISQIHNKLSAMYWQTQLQVVTMYVLLSVM